MIDFKEIYGRSSTVLSVVLVTITHPDLGEMRIVDDNRVHTYKGLEYIPYPFRVDFPDEAQNSSSQGSVTLANFDDRLIEIVRTQPQGITLRIDAEYLQNGEYENIINVNFRLSDIKITDISISAGLILQNVLDDAFPALTMTALTCRGLV